MTRLPWEPLEVVVRAGLPRHDMNGCGCHTNGPRREGVCVTVRDIARRICRDQRTIWRWMSEGIPEALAYEIADNVREHPWLIWPELGDRMVDEARAEMEARDEQRRAKHAEAERRRYETDDEYRERKLAENAAYYLANHEVELQRRRTHYRLNREQRLAAQAVRYQENREAKIAYQREYRARKRAERAA